MAEDPDEPTDADRSRDVPGSPAPRSQGEGDATPPDDCDVPEDDSAVLTPEELRLEDEDVIEKIGENRYIVSPNDSGNDGEDAGGPLSTGSIDGPAADAPPDVARPPDEQDATDVTDDPAPRTGSPTGRQEPEASRAAADSTREPDRRDAAAGQDRPDVPEAPDMELEARTVGLEHDSGRHGIDAVVKTGDGITERRITADDHVAVFEEFLVWYARQIDGETPPSATISSLLAEADLSE